jgi:hypothetical protein
MVTPWSLACCADADEELERRVAADAHGHQLAGPDVPGDVIILQQRVFPGLVGPLPINPPRLLNGLHGRHIDAMIGADPKGRGRRTALQLLSGR